MTSDIEYPHIFVQDKPKRSFFRPVTGGSDDPPPEPPPIRNRGRHAQAIKNSVVEVVERYEGLLRQQLDYIPKKETGVFVKALARSDWGIADSIPGKVDILSISGKGLQMQTKFFLPIRALESFTKAADNYAEVVNPDAGRRPIGFRFFESIERIEEMRLSDLWTSTIEDLPPVDEKYDWEVWVRPQTEEWFRAAAERRNLTLSQDTAKFQEITVLAAHGTGRNLLRALYSTRAAVELRPASRLTAEFFRTTRTVHREVGNRIAAQLSAPADDAPVVCLLDSGVNTAHPLLVPAFNGVEALAARQNWHTQDHHGHGTAMAGVATFGNLTSLVVDPQPVELTHGLESVAVVAQAGAEARDLPATTIGRAVRRTERENGNKTRIFCLAMNAPKENANGRPTALSTVLDQLASQSGAQRLFCVAGGNLDQVQLRADDYITANDLSPIMAPGQAFNVLTVGACTELDELNVNTHAPLAGKGDLCPTSRTAISWLPYMCHKPDIVMEGGNMAIDRRNRRVESHEALSILTTEANIRRDLFTLTGDTSAATAAAARLAARVNAAYPNLWPETTKALLVHSARWTDAMKARARGQGRNEDVLHRFGFGIPSEERVLENAKNILTLIVQQPIRPLRVVESLDARGKLQKRVNLGQMAWHDLPWPKEALRQLGEVEVELRVTLCHFPEPNPTEVARNRPDWYSGYSLTFDVKRPTEREGEALRRVNAIERERLGKPAKTDKLNWTFGPLLRGHGSLQHDIWTGTAAALADMGAVMVMPKKGWWSGRPDYWEEEGRYALVVSITSPSQDVEIYNQIEVVV